MRDEEKLAGRKKARDLCNMMDLVWNTFDSKRLRRLVVTRNKPTLRYLLSSSVPGYEAHGRKKKDGSSERAPSQLNT